MCSTKRWKPLNSPNFTHAKANYNNKIIDSNNNYKLNTNPNFANAAQSLISTKQNIALIDIGNYHAIWLAQN